MKLTNEEKVLHYLIEKYKNSVNPKIYIDKSNLQLINMTESDTIRAIYTLEADKKLIINIKPQQDNFSSPWRVTLTSSGIYHFDNKEEKQKEKRNNWIQFWIPVTLSIIAIIVSIIF